MWSARSTCCRPVSAPPTIHVTSGYGTLVHARRHGKAQLLDTKVRGSFAVQASKSRKHGALIPNQVPFSVVCALGAPRPRHARASRVCEHAQNHMQATLRNLFCCPFSSQSRPAQSAAHLQARGRRQRALVHPALVLYVLQAAVEAARPAEELLRRGARRHHAGRATAARGRLRRLRGPSGLHRIQGCTRTEARPHMPTRAPNH